MPAGSNTMDAAPARSRPALGLGERLRSARKARAMSVAQAAEALHLEEDSVRALEEERFEALGAPVFVRGHLRRYAQLVGLSTDAVLDAYRAAVPESDRLPTLTRPRAPAESLRVGSWIWWVAAAAIFVIFVLVFSGGAEDEAKGTGTPQQLAPALPGLQGLPPPGEAASGETGGSTSVESEPAPDVSDGD